METPYPALLYLSGGTPLLAEALKCSLSVLPPYRRYRFAVLFMPRTVTLAVPSPPWRYEMAAERSGAADDC